MKAISQRILTLMPASKNFLFRYSNGTLQTYLPSAYPFCVRIRIVKGIINLMHEPNIKALAIDEGAPWYAAQKACIIYWLGRDDQTNMT